MNRWKIAATSARVAVAAGARVSLLLPEIRPVLTAQATASCAQGLTSAASRNPFIESLELFMAPSTEEDGTPAAFEY